MLLILNKIIKYVDAISWIRSHESLSFCFSFLKNLFCFDLIFKSAGPFISVVLSKLENMLENSLHVNLLLIGIITHLASYPQPLLRSFLLNTNMVFQPSVRSLYQVLL